MKKYHLVVILVFKIHVVEMIQTFGPGNINAASISLTTNKPSYISQKYQSTAKINNLVTKCEEEVKKTLTETQRDNSLLKDIQSNQNLISSKQNTITKCDQETIKTKPLSVVNKTQVITLSTKIFPLSTLNKNLITINKCEDETLITKSRSNEKLISIEKKITVSTKVLTNLDQTLNITQIITSPTKVSTLSASSKNKSPENLSDRENITTKNAQINMQNDKIISKCELEKETKKVIKNTTAIPKTSSGANEKYKTIIPTIITKCENEILYYKSTKSTITAKSLVITDLTTAKLVETKTKPIVTKYSSIISQDIFTTSTAGHETSVKENQISTKVPAMSSKLPTSSNQIDISEKPSVSTESIISEQKTDHKESTRASLFSVKPTTSVATSTEKEASQKPSVSEKSTILATKTDKMKSTEESLFSAQPTSTAGPEEETSSIRKVLSSTLPPISSKLPTSIEQNISQKPFVSEKPTVLPTKEEEIQSTQASSVSVTPTLNATTKEHQASEKVKQFSTTIFISSTSIEEKASKKPSVSEKSTISVTTADELQSPKASSVPVQPTSCAEEHQTSTIKNQVSTTLTPISSKLPTSNKVKTPSQKSSLLENTTISITMSDLTQSTKASSVPYQPTTCADEHIKIKEVSTTGSPITSKLPISIQQETSKKAFVSENSTVLPTKPDKTQFSQESSVSIKLTSTKATEEHQTSAIEKQFSTTVSPISSKLPTTIEQETSQKSYVSEKSTILATKTDKTQSTQASSVSGKPTSSAATEEHQISEKEKQFSTTVSLTSSKLQTSIEQETPQKSSVSEKSTIAAMKTDKAPSSQASSVSDIPTSTTATEEHQTSVIEKQFSTTVSPISSKLPTTIEQETSQKPSVSEKSTILATKTDKAQSSQASSVSGRQASTVATEEHQTSEIEKQFSTTVLPTSSKLQTSINQETSQKPSVLEKSTIVETKNVELQSTQASSVSRKPISTEATEGHQTSAIEKQFSSTVSPISSKLPTTIEQETSEKPSVSEKSTLLATKTVKTQSTQASLVSDKPTSTAATEEHQTSAIEKQFSTTVSLTSSKLQTSINQETSQKPSVLEKSTIVETKNVELQSTQASSVSRKPISTEATEGHQTSAIEKQFSSTVSPISSKLPTTIEQETSQKPSLSEKSTVLATKTDKTQSIQASLVSDKPTSTVATDEHQASAIEKQFSTTVSPTSLKLQTSINQETSQKTSVLEKSTIVETKNVEIQSTQASSVSRKPISTEATEGHQTSAIEKQFSSTVSPISSKLPTTIEQETSEKPSVSEKSTLLATKTVKTQSTQASLVSDKPTSTAATEEHQTSAIEKQFSTTVSLTSSKLQTSIEQETPQKSSVSEKSTIAAMKTDKAPSSQASSVSGRQASTVATEEHQTSEIEKQFSTTVLPTSSKLQTSINQETSQKPSVLEKSTIVETKNVELQSTQASSVSRKPISTEATEGHQTSAIEKQFSSTVSPISSKLPTTIEQETSEKPSVSEKSTLLATKTVKTQSIQASLVSDKPTSTAATEEHQTSAIEKQFSTTVSLTSSKLQTSIEQETPQKSSVSEKSTIAAMKTDKAPSSQASSVSDIPTSTTATEEHQTSVIEKQFSTTVSPISSKLPTTIEQETSQKPSVSEKSTILATKTDKAQSSQASSVSGRQASTVATEEHQTSKIEKQFSTTVLPTSSKLQTSINQETSQKPSVLEKSTIVETKNVEIQSTQALSVSRKPISTEATEGHQTSAIGKQFSSTVSPISSKLPTTIEQETSEKPTLSEKSTILATKTDKTQSTQASLVSDKSNTTAATKEHQSSAIEIKFSTTVSPISLKLLTTIEQETSEKPSLSEKSTLLATKTDKTQSTQASLVSDKPTSTAATEEHQTSAIEKQFSTTVSLTSSKFQTSVEQEASQKYSGLEKSTIVVTKNVKTQPTQVSSVSDELATTAAAVELQTSEKEKQFRTTVLPTSSKLQTSINQETSQSSSVLEKSTIVETKNVETQSTQASLVSYKPTSTSATEEHQTSSIEKQFSTPVSPTSLKLQTSINQETPQKSSLLEKSTIAAKTDKAQSSQASSVSSKLTSTAPTEEHQTSEIEKQFSTTVSPMSSSSTETKTSIKPSLSGKSTFSAITTDKLQTFKTSSIPVESTSCAEEIQFSTIKSEMSTKPISSKLPISVELDASSKKSSFIEKTTILATKNDQTQSTRASSVSVQPTTCADEHKSIKRSNTTESPISSKLSTSIEQETSQSFSILEKSTILATKTDKTQSNQASLVSSKSTSTGSTEEQQSSGILKQFSTTVLPMSSSSSIESKTSIKPSVLEKSTLPGTIADDLHTFRTSSVSVQPSSCAEEHLTPTIKNHVSTKLTPISSKLQISKKFETSSQKSTISEKTTISVTKNDLTQSTKASSVPVQPTTCADEHKIIKQLSTTELSPISSKLLTNIEHETSQKTSVSDKSTFVSTKTDETKSTQASSVSNQPTSTDATEEQQTSKFEKKFSTTVSPNSSKLPTSVEQETSQKPVSEKSTDTAKYTKKTQTTYSSSVSSKPTSSAATEEYLTSAIEKQFSSTVSPISSKLSTTIKQETSHKHSVLDKSSNFVQPTNDTTQSSKVSSIQGKPTSFLTTVGHKTNVSTIISTSMQQNASKIKSSFIQTTTSKHDTMMFDYTKISQETFVSTKQRSSKRPTKIKIRIISCNDSSTSNLKTRISSSPVSSTSADIGTTLEASTTSSTIATVTLQDSTMQHQLSTDSTTYETSTDVL
ncbi:serine-rich adhesin for platelets isoform X3 [Hydra vulgaris]|uniref:Serine-rich adhesin for platelets isoform X3 n=1 Tax=Hydra vulgaris TaxID=6087 RepID=A0ABM4D2F7_HYDVU